jgi:thiol-disulfide isomerase/thioredoxin
VTASGRSRLLIALFCVASLLAVVGCGNQPEAALSSSASAAELAPREPAPNFTITLYQGAEQLGGESVDLARLAGKRLVLNFYAGNCPPCRAEMPALEAAYQQYKDKVLLVGVDIGPFTGLGTREEGKRLLADLRVTYPAGTTFDSNVPVQYQLLVIPATYSVTSDGKILRKFRGGLDQTSALLFFEELVRASPAK